MNKKNIRIVCGTAAAYFCIWMLGFMIWYGFEMCPMYGTASLCGFNIIHPAVMFDGRYYVWDGICKELPEGCFYYGEIHHFIKKRPQNNREFVSFFLSEGELYAAPDEDCVYLILTTTWLNDAVVKFVPVKLKRG